MDVRERPRLRRFGVLTVLAGLFAAAMAVIAPSVAQADTVPYFCQQNPVPAADSFVHDRHDGKDWLSVFKVNWWSQTFDAGTAVSGDKKWIHNNEDSASAFPFRVSETMSQEKSTSVTQGAQQAGVNLNSVIKGINLTLKLDRTVTEKVTFSQTIESTFTIDPFTAKQIEYGVFGYVVNYDVTVYVLHDDGTRCEYRGDKSGNVSRYTPTHHGWNVTVLPRINVGGILNPDGWNYTIRACTPVAIFGRFFPPDQVIVRQGSRQWSPIGPGTPWWYDSPSQINASLPCDMQANAYASLAVRRVDPFGRFIEGFPQSVFIYP
jgi:hypothetical protein